ncbi:protein pal1 [Podospora conica]|nr:protein pal1 [Schizothecium conicum]
MTDIDYDKMQRKQAYDYVLGPLYDLEPSQVAAQDNLNKQLPITPPASPPRPGFFKRLSQSSLRESARKDDQLEDSEPQSPLREYLRRNSTRRSTRPHRSHSASSQTQAPRHSQKELASILYTSEPAQTSWNQGTILSRANSVATSNPTVHRNKMASPRDTSHRRGQSLNAPFPQSGPSKSAESHNSNHVPRRGVSLRDPGPVPHILDQPIHEGGPPTTNSNAKGKGPRRERSLRERYPGDMSHRPLDVIRKQTRAADRAPHLHTPHRQQPRDTIDGLDCVGPTGTYHHSGPFDPVLATRNTDPKTSPLEAVKDSNAEALRATPAAHLQDSMAKHVPLQGTATVPPGHPDLTGRTMQYEEGADLMREPDAAGGAYKRWDHITYRDDDLKGKGEPSYTYERDLSARKAVPRSSRRRGEEDMGVEMTQPRSTGTGYAHDSSKDGSAQVRHRSVKPLPSPPVEEERSDPFADPYVAQGSTSGVQRRGIVGSIKRKFGSLRRK